MTQLANHPTRDILAMRNICPTNNANRDHCSTIDDLLTFASLPSPLDKIFHWPWEENFKKRECHSHKAPLKRTRFPSRNFYVIIRIVDTSTRSIFSLVPIKVSSLIARADHSPGLSLPILCCGSGEALIAPISKQATTNIVRNSVSRQERKKKIHFDSRDFQRATVMNFAE